MTEYHPDDAHERALSTATTLLAAAIPHSRMSVEELSDALTKLHATSLSCLTGAPAEAGATVKAPEKLPTPAEITASIKHDGITSFEDGRVYKTMKRHLTLRGLSPAQYRVKWGLPPDYPMVAPAYAEQRSALAKAIGLGRPVKAEGPSPA